MLAIEVAQHNTADDLYCIINGNVYDLSLFAAVHPGGMRSILSMGGKDATKKFNLLHPPNTLASLDSSYNLGPVDISDAGVVVVEKKVVKAVEKLEEKVQESMVTPILPMRLIDCLSLDDFEKAAEQSIDAKAWAWYSSAADDRWTLQNNRDSYRYVSFRPRALKNVERINLSTKILGFNSNLPIFIAPAAMGKLGHPDGENCLARVANSSGIPYIVSANASISFEDLAGHADTQTLMYQVSVNRNRSVTKELLKKVKEVGYKAVVLNVGSPVTGKLELNSRFSLAESLAEGDSADVSSLPSISESIGSLENAYLDAGFTWKDLDWLRKCTDLPLVVKGIQSVEDALLCEKYGVDVIYLSNHGGRQLDGSPSALETLMEIKRFAPQILESTEIWLDGGIRRGTDVLKALALGATAVGIGRGFMYSLLFGDDGVQAVVNIMTQELATGLRLLGCTNLEELNSSLVNTRRLDNLIYQGALSKI